jgi:hypothetical protein
MIALFPDAESMFAAIITMAEELRAGLVPMDGPTRAQLLSEIVANSEMVFGVWPDPAAEDGHGIAVIKGADLMPPLEGFETAEEVRIAAIPCAGEEQAVAASQLWSVTAADPETEAEVAEQPDSRQRKLSATGVKRSLWALSARGS